MILHNKKYHFSHTFDEFIITSDVLIIGSVIGISQTHYWSLFLVLVSVISGRCNRYCKKCINNVISCDYDIINGFYDTHNYWVNSDFHWIRNQKVDIISDRYRYISKVIIGLSVKSLIGASHIYKHQPCPY